MEKMTFEKLMKQAAKAVSDKDVQAFLALSEDSEEPDNAGKIIDVTGVELASGEPERCPGNGEHVDVDGHR